MFVGSRFCTNCGAAAVREQLDDTPLPCPRCKSDMNALALGATRVRECGQCGGLWIDPAGLQALCDAREQHAAVISALSARVPAVPIAFDVVKYIPCPACKKLMNRTNFAHSSGVIVDVCKNDGAWLDRGELQRIIDFVEHGGLDASREKERERLVYEQQRLAAMQKGEPVPEQTHATPALDSFLRDALGMFLK